jgi:hypothetical protein
VTVINATLRVECPSKSGPVALAEICESIPDSPDSISELSPIDYADIKARLDAMLTGVRERVMEQLETLEAASHARRQDRAVSKKELEGDGTNGSG